MLSIFCFSFQSEAQTAEDRDNRKAKRIEMKAETKQYLQDNVFPVITEKHNTLLEKMSSEDRQKVEALRAQMAEHKKHGFDKKRKMRTHHKSDLAKREKPSKEEIEKRRSERKLHKEEVKKIREEAMLIVGKYQETIDLHLSELKENKAQWKDDMRKIKESYRSEKERPSSEDKNMEDVKVKKKGERSGRKHKRKRKGKKLDATSYLLWDGGVKSLKSNGMLEMRNIAVDKETFVYPNPGSDQLNIVFNLSSPEKNIAINIISTSGKLIKKYSFTNLAVGENNIKLDISNIPKGSYIYTIQGESINESSQMIIK